MSTPCTVRYVVKGVADQYLANTSIDLLNEIQEVLPNPGSVSVISTDRGMDITISVTDIEPFNRDMFELFIYEQVLWHAVHATCRMEGDRFEFLLQSVLFDT
jgi:hypothetical protein